MTHINGFLTDIVHRICIKEWTVKMSTHFYSPFCTISIVVVYSVFLCFFGSLTAFFFRLFYGSQLLVVCLGDGALCIGDQCIALVNGILKNAFVEAAFKGLLVQAVQLDDPV